MQSNVKNEYYEYGNANVMNVMKLMLGSFDRFNVRSECGNGGMLGVNVEIEEC